MPLNVILPLIALIASSISLVISIMKRERLMILRDIAIIFLALTLMLANIQFR